MAKRKRTNEKQRPANHTHKTKDRVTRTIPTTGGELRCFGRVSSFCSTIEVPLASQGSDRSYIRVLGVSSLPISTIVLLHFRTVLTLWNVSVFHFITI
jgi:hypothetical protein